MFMRCRGLFVLPVLVALLLTSCAAEEPFPTEWPEFEAIDGVLDVFAKADDAGHVPGIHVQLDDRAEPAAVVRAAVEVCDLAAGLAPFADGFDLGILIERPGGVPTESQGWWEDSSCSDDDFASIVATLATFGFPAPATGLHVSVEAFDHEDYDNYETWRIDAVGDLDEPTQVTLKAALAAVATEQGHEISGRVIVYQESQGE
jgi:hypothetical protein